MTYLQFHLVFLAPAILVLGGIAWRLRGRANGRDPGWALPLLAVVAFVYTTPWDNYLVYRAVWTYGADRVLGTVGYVPVEEYAFFLLQPVLTGLWYLVVRPWTPPPRPASAAAPRWGGAGFGALAVAGLVLVTAGGHGLYLGLILAWACPVLAGMWALAGAKLARRRALLAWAVGPPTLYLWVADRVAIGQGIWDITDATRTGLDLLGLPVEEAVFFLLTNLLVAQGLVLFLEEGASTSMGSPLSRAPLMSSRT